MPRNLFSADSVVWCFDSPALSAQISGASSKLIDVLLPHRPVFRLVEVRTKSILDLQFWDFDSSSRRLEMTSLHYQQVLFLFLLGYDLLIASQKSLA